MSCSPRLAHGRLNWQISEGDKNVRPGGIFNLSFHNPATHVHNVFDKNEKSLCSAKERKLYRIGMTELFLIANSNRDIKPKNMSAMTNIEASYEVHTCWHHIWHHVWLTELYMQFVATVPGWLSVQLKARVERQVLRGVFVSICSHVIQSKTSCLL